MATVPKNDMAIETNIVGARGRFRTRAPKLGHQPALDGIRGYGIIAVLLGHSFINGWVQSFAAVVDIFFVVSGFLIITLLLEESNKMGSVNLRNFYRRRALRLLPVLFLVIGVTLIGTWLISMWRGNTADAPFPGDISNGGVFELAKQDALAGAFYVYHVFHPVGAELAGGSPDLRPLSPLWSLSVEEHFYVFGVLVALLAIARGFVKHLMTLFALAFVFIATARLLGFLGPRLAWYQRPDAILLGVMLAFLNATLPTELSPRFRRNLSRAATLAALVAAVTFFVGTGFARPLNVYVSSVPAEGDSLKDGFYWVEIGFTLVSLSSAVIVLAMARLDKHWLMPILSWKPIRLVGLRSYAIYLIHVPLLLLLVNAFAGEPVIGLLLYLPALVLTTELTHRYAEKPMMKSKNRQPKPVATE